MEGLAGRLLLWSDARSAPRSVSITRHVEFVTQLIDDFRGSDSEFRMLVTPSRIDDIRSKGALELVLEEPLPVKLGVLDRSILLSRLLALRRELAVSHGRVTFYFGDPDYGQFNVVSAIASSGLQRALERLGE